MIRSPWTRRGLALAAVIGLVLIAAWLRHGSHDAVAVRDSSVGAQPPRLAPPTLWRPAPVAPAPELATDGVPVMGPGASDSTANGPRHPHPITAKHQRIFRENALVAALDGAMDAGDFRELRRLNQDYRALYPEDGLMLQAGYELIADCLERRTPDNRAAAENYFQSQRGSTLRRYVHRHCLE